MYYSRVKKCLAHSTQGQQVSARVCHSLQVDVVTHHTLPDFIRTRGGVSLRPGDGIIHSCARHFTMPGIWPHFQGC